MDCCENCLSSSFIRDHIKVKAERVADCKICHSKDVILISCERLLDLFNPIFELYKLNSNGLPLISHLKNDWPIFDDVSYERIKIIFKGSIYGDEDLSRNYVPIIEEQDLFDWASFKEELKHTNRFFPTKFPEPNSLSALINSIATETINTKDKFYRARIQHDSSTQFSKENMGAPPKLKATNGRANPFGISYLYIASTINTAVSEVRHHNGESLTIATFEALNDLKLVDLRKPRESIVPFRHSEASLKSIYRGLNLLETLGKELTKPISQHKAQLEYLSSQYICEFIKSQGFDGVIYKSSLGDGDNYAIFQENNLVAIDTQQILISSINITHETI
jgi:hypothetical protein